MIIHYFRQNKATTNIPRTFTVLERIKSLLCGEEGLVPRGELTDILSSTPTFELHNSCGVHIKPYILFRRRRGGWRGVCGCFFFLRFTRSFSVSSLSGMIIFPFTTAYLFLIYLQCLDLLVWPLRTTRLPAAWRHLNTFFQFFFSHMLMTCAASSSSSISHRTFSLATPTSPSLFFHFLLPQFLAQEDKRKNAMAGEEEEGRRHLQRSCRRILKLLMQLA